MPKKISPNKAVTEEYLDAKLEPYVTKDYLDKKFAVHTDEIIDVVKEITSRQTDILLSMQQTL